MREYLKFYIDGQWVDPLQPNAFDVENPATEQVSGKISLGSAAGVDVAVNAARGALSRLAWAREAPGGLGGRRRRGRQSSPPSVRRLVADHPRRASRAVAGHPRRIPKTRGRPRRGGHRRK